MLNSKRIAHLIASLMFCCCSNIFFPIHASAYNKVVDVDGALRSMEQASGAPIKAVIASNTGLATLVVPKPGHPISVPGAEAGQPAEVARRFLDKFGMAFGLADTSKTRRSKIKGPDEVGMAHVRYQQVHDGVPIRGAEITIHVKGADVVNVQAKTLPDPVAVDTTPTLMPASAIEVARKFIEEQGGGGGGDGTTFSTPALEIFNLGILDNSRTTSYLTWFIEARRSAFHQFIWVDAHTGQVIHNQDMVAQALIREVWDHQNSSDPALTYRVTSFPTGDAHIDNAYNYAGNTYNFYFNFFGRDSWDGAGSPLILNVHYVQGLCNNYASGFWGNGQTYYCGNQTVAIDVVGHEITHGVLESSGVGYYADETATINEAYSYIFGESVDQVYGPASSNQSLRWKWAEELIGDAAPDFRYPEASGYAGKVSDPQLVCGTGTDAAHRNAWVLAHAFALMTDGSTYNGYTITGIGLEKAAKIHYRAMTTYLQGAPTFLDNYYGLIQSCQDLIGTSMITANDCAEATKALDAVEMSLPLCPDFLLTANNQNTIEVRNSRQDGTFEPPVLVGDNLGAGVNYVEFAIGPNYNEEFIAATNESPSRLFWFSRTGRAIFQQKFVVNLAPDPSNSPQYGLGLTSGFHPMGIRFFLDNKNVAFPLSDGATGYWIAKGDFYLGSAVSGGVTNNVSPDAYDFSSIFTGWTLAKSSTLGDVNGDGFADMLASEQAVGGAVSSRVYLLTGGRDTSQIPYRYFWNEPVYVFTTNNNPASHMTLGDFNNDGKVDAIVGQDDDGDPGAAFLYFGHGDGTFEQVGRKVFDVQPTINTGSDQPGAGNFQAYDVDRDGILDIISAYKKNGVSDPDESSRLVFIRGLGNGYFAEPVAIEENLIYRTAFTAPLTLPRDLFLLQGADLNHDQCVDVADMGIILKDLRNPSTHDPYFDLNGDGVVNLLDVRELRNHFTNPSGTPCQ